MNKKVFASILACVMAVATLTGCGDKNITSTNLKDVKVEKYVTLKDYKSIPVTVAAKEAVTDADINYFIQNKMDANQELHLTEGTVGEGHLVNIDYCGKIDDVAFEGGTAQDQLLLIGSHQFIDGFEAGLVGASVGQTVDLNLQFPENYGKAELAGQPCVFTVSVNYIVAPLSDENVNIVDPEYTDATSYVDAVRKTLEDYVDYQYNYSVSNQIATQLLSLAEFKNIPESLIADYQADLKVSAQNTATANGMTLEDYMYQRYNIQPELIDAKITEMAKQCAQEGLVIQAIANAEDLNITEEELDAELQKETAESGSASVEEFLAQYGDKEKFRVGLLYEKVYNFLQENADITEQ